MVGRNGGREGGWREERVRAERRERERGISQKVVDNARRGEINER